MGSGCAWAGAASSCGLRSVTGKHKQRALALGIAESFLITVSNLRHGDTNHHITSEAGQYVFVIVSMQADMPRSSTQNVCCCSSLLTFGLGWCLCCWVLWGRRGAMPLVPCRSTLEMTSAKSSFSAAEVYVSALGCCWHAHALRGCEYDTDYQHVDRWSCMTEAGRYNNWPAVQTHNIKHHPAAGMCGALHGCAGMPGVHQSSPLLHSQNFTRLAASHCHPAHAEGRTCCLLQE